MRKMLRKLPLCNKYNLAAILSLAVVGLAVPQVGFAQVPDVSGNWTGNIVLNNQTTSTTASLSSSSTSVSGSIQTNNPQLASSSVASTNEATTQATATCAGCTPAPATTNITLVFNGLTVQLSGTIDGSNFANGSFSASDNTGRTINGTASGTISSTSVSVNFSGTNNAGAPQNGTISATSDNNPPPPPGGGCTTDNSGNVLCMPVTP